MQDSKLLCGVRVRVNGVFVCVPCGGPGHRVGKMMDG